MILDLLQHQGHILAITDQGYLYTWHISQYQQGHTYHFPLNIAVVPNIGALPIAKSLLGIVKNNTQLVLYNHWALFVVGLPGQMQEQNLREISLKGQIGEMEGIKSVVVADEETLLVATDKATLLLYNLQLDKVERSRSLVQSNSNTQILATSGIKTPLLTHLVSLSDKNIGFLAFDNGRIFSFDLQQLRILHQITSKSKHPLQPISKLYLKPQQSKLYSLHQNYLIQWNYRHSSAVSYLQYPQPQGVLKHGDTLLVAGLVPVLTRVDDQKGIKEMELSMRGVGVIKSVGGLVVVGGSDNLVDVFADTTRLVTLIEK